MAMTPPITDHEQHGGCWCEPVLDYTAPTGTKVYIHRERGGLEPPPASFVEQMRAFSRHLHGWPGRPEEIHITKLGAMRRVPIRFSLDEMGLEP